MSTQRMLLNYKITAVPVVEYLGSSDMRLAAI